MMLELENITKKFGAFTAVNDVSISVQEGEIFSFLGVNGAGKTTTLRMIVGVLAPSAGEIKIGGYNLRTQAAEAKQITGYIPDRPYLYPKLTAREYLYFVSELYDLPLSEATPRIEELLQNYMLSEWQDELIESYSHGMKQRIATCAALIHKPKLLIVDEPMVGLDPHGAKLLKESFKQYTKEGTTIFLSTHSLNVAEELSDRIAIINHGQIISIGTLDELNQLSGGAKKDLEEIFLHLTINA